jgi:hypothetical protein
MSERSRQDLQAEAVQARLDWTERSILDLTDAVEALVRQSDRTDLTRPPATTALNDIRKTLARIRSDGPKTRHS